MSWALCPKPSRVWATTRAFSCRFTIPSTATNSVFNSSRRAASTWETARKTGSAFTKPELDGVPVFGIEFDRFYARNGVYGDPEEFSDNAFRFALLPKAALQWCKDCDWIPDVAHLHDWSSALGAVFLKTWDRVMSPLSETASVLTIHNIGYAGTFHPSALQYMGLGTGFFVPDIFEDNGKINLLKAGIHFADALTTVSPTHAHELLDPVGGMGLAPYLNNRRGDLTGILNGVDYEDWNPETDKFLPATYSATDLSGKALCKAALQERFGLDFNPKVPIFGIVSRFASQKGFDLLQSALPDALDNMAMQLVVLGTGDRATEQFFHDLTRRYPGKSGQLHRFFGRNVASGRSGQRFFPHAFDLRTVRPQPELFDALRHPSHRASDGRTR